MYFTKIDGAPKFGNALYDPLMYETIKLGEWEYPPYVLSRAQDNEFDGADDDDFLENSDGETAVSTSLHESQNTSRIEASSAPISKRTHRSTNEPTTIIVARTMPTKQSSPIEKSILRKIITSNLAKDAQHVKQTTTLTSETRNSEKTIAIARSSCTSCVDNVQKYEPVALRQGDDGGGSVKKSGYDYDENVCKIINGRILCGYNKNLGEIPDVKVSSNIDGDCQMRDDRIECGYVPGNKPAARFQLSVNDMPAQILDPLSENNPSKSEILRDSSVILINRVRDSPESLGYPTIDNNNFSDPDSNTMKLNQTISEVSSLQNELTVEIVASTVTTASTNKSADTFVYSNTEPVELLNTYFDNANNAIGNFEPTTLPQFPDSPDIIEYVTTVNESINFVAEDQVERRQEEDVQLSDTDGPAFNNFEKNYVQNPNSVKEKNEPHVEVTSDATNYKKVTRCVEIGDRIVCYNIQLKDITPHM